MKFTYRAFDRAGKAVTGSTDAADASIAGELLRRQGLFVTELDGAAGPASARKVPDVRKARVPGRGRRLSNLTAFSRQLHVLVTSGTPLVQALGAIERQATEPAWGAVIGQLRHRVEEGSTMSEGMRAQPAHFDAVCVSLVAAGETSGNMGPMLERLAHLCRKQLQLRNAIIGAMIYPCLLMCLGVVVLIIMMLFVLPRFSEMFKSLDLPLPPTTRVLMSLSDGATTYWWALLAGIGAIVAAARLFFWSDGGRRMIGRWSVSVPKIGRLVRSFATARIARMLGTLLDSHVALVDALDLTRASAGNVLYGELVGRAQEAVQRGEPISVVFASSDLIVACVQEAIRNGEQTGQMGMPLIQMADFLDEQNDVIVKSLTRLAEPAILAVLGVIVGFIAISMFLPLFDMAAAANGGQR